LSRSGDAALSERVNIDSESVNINDGLGEGFWSFLRQIVADAALDGSLCVLAGEFLGVGTGIRVWGAVGVTFHSDGGYGDDGGLGELRFQVVVFSFAWREA
jgi:hypothetical protein